MAFRLKKTLLSDTGAPTSSAYFRRSSFSSFEGLSGTRTPTFSTRSPLPPRPSRPNPRPRSRTFAPEAVPAAIDTVFRALERRDLDVAAQHERGERQVELQDEIVSFALEDLVLRDREHDVEIARGAAVRARVPLSGEPQAGSRLDAGRDLDRQFFLAPAASFSAAARAGLVDDAPVPAAGPAGPRDRQESLREPLAPRAPAGGAGARLRALGGPDAAAIAAALEAGDRDRRFHAMRRVLERDLHPVDEIAAAGGPPGRASEPEDAVEEIREVAEDRRVEAREPSVRPGPRSHAGVPELVVARPLLGIRQHGVGLRRLAEFLGRVGIIGVAVGMVGQRELAIGRT